MSSDEAPVEVSMSFLHGCPLPQAAGTKASRGDAVVVGGSRRSPGAVQLAGLSALRVGAGRLTLVVRKSIANFLALAVPEAGVTMLEESASGRVRGAALDEAGEDLRGADALLLGPGIDDIGEAQAFLKRIQRLAPKIPIVVDAYGLGALATARTKVGTGLRVLTPNRDEAAILLGRPLVDLDADCRSLASTYQSVVTCFGTIAAPDGRLFHVAEGGPGLGTSGSGDVLAGAITGLLARGSSPVQAAIWGTYLHARAGDALSQKVGEVGFLARDISAELTIVLESTRP